MSNMLKDYYAYSRDDYYAKVVVDYNRFRGGKGVTHIMCFSTHMDYEEMAEYRASHDKEFYPIGHFLDEIMDNKWLIHAYDINGTLN
jgi:hypothetical protein